MADPPDFLAPRRRLGDIVAIRKPQNFSRALE
jgi:hypothetical protein